MKRGLVIGLNLVLCLGLLLVSSSCKKRTPSSARPPAPPAPHLADRPPTTKSAPTIELKASPSTIERGDQTTLSWASTNANSVLIDGGIGNVAETGTLVLSPRESTTYTAIAKGSDSDTRASTRVTVVDRSDRSVVSGDLEGLQRAIEEGKVRPVFFQYDLAELSAEGKSILTENARWISQFPSAVAIIEGHCDERGTEEYNLALGDRRAQVARDYLLGLGVAAGQLEALSFGEERPFSTCHEESCWKRNRRAHFVVKR
jgi:peptidoglycan-associated lipoprotein